MLWQTRRSAAVAGMRVPGAPAHAGETPKISRDRPPRLSLVSGDALLRFGDLSLQLGERVLGSTASSDVAAGEAGRFEGFQSVTVLLELNPVPGDFAVAVAAHPRTPDSVSAYHDMDGSGGSAGGDVVPWSTENGERLWQACNSQGVSQTLKWDSSKKARQAAYLLTRSAIRRTLSGLPIVKAVFPVNRLAIAFRKQPAFCLGEVQIEGAGLATGGQKLFDVGHVRGRLVFLRKLLECDQRCRQCFRDHPFVVAGDSLPWHSDRPFTLTCDAKPPRLRTSRPGSCEHGHRKDIERNTASSRPKREPLPLYAAVTQSGSLRHLPSKGASAKLSPSGIAGIF
jgi:hypothetical protein